MSDLVAETTKAGSETTPGKSLIQEVEKLRGEVAQLCQAVRGLAQLQSVANQKLDLALTGKPTFDVL